MSFQGKQYRGTAAVSMQSPSMRHCQPPAGEHPEPGTESALGMAMAISWAHVGVEDQGLMFAKKIQRSENDSARRGRCSQSSTEGSWHLYFYQKLGVNVGNLC